MEKKVKLKIKKLLCLILLFIAISCYIFTDEFNNVDLKKINDFIWIHTSHQNINDFKTPSNGLIIISKKGLILIDTPWNNNQTKELIKITKNKFNKNIILAIITHFHQDRIGGINTLIENNIETKCTELTAKLAEKAGYQKPKGRLNDDITLFDFDDIKFEAYFPGAGHTYDNIIIWFAKYKILFGGCLIKSEDSNNLGNIADSNIKLWHESIKNIKKKYQNIDIIIPGHGNWSKNNLLDHTLDLLKNNK